jgi:hypothetical protein
MPALVEESMPFNCRSKTACIMARRICLSVGTLYRVVLELGHGQAQIRCRAAIKGLKVPFIHSINI